MCRVKIRFELKLFYWKRIWQNVLILSSLYNLTVHCSSVLITCVRRNMVDSSNTELWPILVYLVIALFCRSPSCSYRHRMWGTSGVNIVTKNMAFTSLRERTVTQFFDFSLITIYRLYVWFTSVYLSGTFVPYFPDTLVLQLTFLYYTCPGLFEVVQRRRVWS